MVKIRLRRMGTKGAPFYRVVVTESTSGRSGKFDEIIGTYDPVKKPTRIQIKNDRALHWLLAGAQPSETTAYLLNKVGVLDEFFAQRPNAKKGYKFLDKRTSAMSKKSVIDAPKVEAAKAAEPVAEAPAPVEEAPAEVVAEAPAAEATPAAEETPAE